MADLFDYIWDLLPQDPKELEELLKFGVIYIPYIPLQVTKIELIKDKDYSELK